MNIRTRKHLIGAVAGAVLAIGAEVCSGETVRGQSKEYALKARMVVRMIPYVSWPKDTFKKGKTLFTIGVLGVDPFGKSLEAAFEKARPKGCKVQIVRLGDWSKIKDQKSVLRCHALFIAASERKHLARIVAGLRGAPVWVVSDAPGFAKSGAHINFFVAKTIRFETNAPAARTVGLRMSSKLLRLGRAVR